MSASNSPPLSLQPSKHEKEEAAGYLRSLINKNFRVTTTDSRMFWGTFKCTDPESNIVLQHTYEYRHPTAQQVANAASATAQGGGDQESETKLKVDMTSRYLGLVVIPGKYITRIEVEEFLSQMPGRRVKVLGVGEQQFGGGTPPSEDSVGVGDAS
ncbi:hypothetical protein P885DRAFT_58212 [Corynascus similis CBS 632.67]